MLAMTSFLPEIMKENRNQDEERRKRKRDRNPYSHFRYSSFHRTVAPSLSANREKRRRFDHNRLQISLQRAGSLAVILHVLHT
jgi:hypothetical protein